MNQTWLTRSLARVRGLPQPWRWVVPGMVLAVAVASTGVAIWPGGSRGATGTRSVSGKAVPAVAVAPVQVTVQPGNGAAGVRLDARVRVAAHAGLLRSVRVTTAGGRRLAGKLSADRQSWRSAAALAPDVRYKIEVVAADAADRQVRRTSSFATMRPAGELRTSIMPLDGETVGAGMPIAVWFTEPVRNKAAVERRLRVTSSSGVVGAWHWFDDKHVRYRPRSYWPAGERVTLHAALAGVDAGRGVWGVGDRRIGFSVGAQRVSTVNVHSHRMTVTDNGRKVRTMPASTGRDKFPTTNGSHTVLGKERERVMDSANTNLPQSERYRVRVQWAVRISNTGEFVHSAPWSVGAQGRANVSHGCVNLSPENASWFFRSSRRGDIVRVVGSPRKPGESEGLLEWNRSWSAWRAGSALA
jgi:lipoprotein-anchoring transpeptidase ErfK/SrfK